MTSIEFLPTSVADDPKEIAESLAEMQKQATKERVPWFQQMMPESYFRQVPKERRLRHLVSIAAVADLGDIPELVSTEVDDQGRLKTLSVISSADNAHGSLGANLKRLPDKTRLQGVNLYTSNDHLLTVTEFIVNEQVQVEEKLPLDLEAYAAKLMDGSFEQDRQQFFQNNGEVLHATPCENFSEENLIAFMKNIVHPGLYKVSPRRFCKFVQMYHNLLKKGTDEVLLDVETNYCGETNKSMYTLALTNAYIKPTLTRVSRYLEHHKGIIERCHVERVIQDRNFEDSEVEEYNDVAFLRVLVDHSKKSSEKTLKEIQSSLPLVAKWYDDSVMNNYYKIQKKENFVENLQPVDFEVVTGLLECVHLVCSGSQMYEFSKPNIYQVLNRPQTFAIVEAFKQRFDPFTQNEMQNDAAFESRLEEIRQSYNEYIEIDVERKVLDKMIEVVKGTERTNLYNKERFGFSLKLDPKVCMDKLDTQRQETPFGVFFVNGRRIRGLQVRFREIARGGLRLVTPNSGQALEIESTRQFGECYDLAFAQQQKNKDIAEGGSKAVALIDSFTHPDNSSRKHVLRKCVKSFVNSILDLITVNDTNKTEELIFLGPDEQIGVEHINWIVRRAAERNYRMPAAFMSSKPDHGINHKEFGVTSEGVAVFLDVALKSLDILEKPFFTVKITGGPDGDVAGNMLKILHREYGDKCRVVGIADGTGCVEDPNGINMEELLRLVDESLPLDQINPSALSNSTEVFDLSKAEGVLKRNTMHNRVHADAFIPGGGRPQTVNGTNWQKFLFEENGKKVPSSKLIVEGANLFFTNQARKQLAKYGCVVVKDSSANKAGVICSAFEIISCMLLDKQSFLDIKSTLVPQVVERLKIIARREAELLMKEFRRNTTKSGDVAEGFNLVDVSIAISKAINRTTDCIRGELQQRVEKEGSSILKEFKPLVKAHLPDELVNAGWKDFDEKVPEVYVVNLVSTLLACELVYNEGIDFVFSIQDDEVLTETAFRYIKEKNLVQDLVSRLSNLSESESHTVSRLLELGGPRVALMAGGVKKL